MSIDRGPTDLAGGYRIEAGQRPTEDLVRIAAAARSNGGRVTFSGLTERPVRELLQIVAAGGMWVGRVASSRR